jgi:type IV pilus assembly PilX-like protein
MCRRAISTSHGDGALPGNDHGVALVVAIMTMTLMLSLGSALILLSSSETAIAANFRANHEALYAADAAIERTIADLRTAPDWTAVLNGTLGPSFVDGDSTGRRTLVDGSTIDLAQITNLANCEKATACSDADMDAVTAERPWGALNPRWAPFSHGRLADLLGAATVSSPFFVIAFVADDPSEIDGDPLRDGGSADGQPSPGLGLVVVRGEAFGPRRAHKVVEATIRRIQIPAADPDQPGSTELRVVSWRERQ